MENIYTLPIGATDILDTESKLKIQIIKQIQKVFDAYNYKSVVPSMFDYLELYTQSSIGIDEKQIISFQGDEGKLIALRADFTLPIARIVATKYKNLPSRISYVGETYQKTNNILGRRSETTVAGVELIGIEEVLAEEEILSIVSTALKKLNVKKPKIVIGSSKFFKRFLQLLALTNEEERQFSDIMSYKKISELEKFVDNKFSNLSKEQQSYIKLLPWQFGDINELIEKFAWEDDIVSKELDRLNKLQQYAHLKGFADMLEFDLSIVPRLNYYTGIVFKGYCQGVGDDILAGGRYDKLLEQFGLDCPAIGFSFNITNLIKLIGE